MQRGVVNLRRPIPPVVPQRASGAVASVTSNLYLLARDQGLMLFSYFPRWSEKMTGKEKIDNLKAWLEMTDTIWIVTEALDAVYTLDKVECEWLSPGPRVEADLIDSLRLWKLVEKNTPKDDLGVELRPVVVEGSKSKLALIVHPGWQTIPISALVDFFTSICGRNIEKFNQQVNSQKGKRLRVECSHYKAGRSKRRYNIVRMSDRSAKETRIEIRGLEMTVERYFSDVHKITLKDPDAPLVVDDHGRVFPMELCVISEPVRTERSKPPQRIEEISHSSILLKNLEKFGIKIASGDVVKSRGRQLPGAPVRAPLPVNRHITASIMSMDDAVGDAMFERLVQEADLTIGAKLKLEKIESISSNFWEKDLKKIVSKWTERPDLVLVFLRGKLDDSMYERMKYVIEFKLGLVSQFVIGHRLASVNNPEAYWHSLLSNISLKLGPQLPSMKPSGTVIAGIAKLAIDQLNVKLMSATMSYDNGMHVFVTQVKAQARKRDFDFENIFYNLLMGYFGTCRNFPNRVIMFVKKPEAAILYSSVAGMLKGVHAAVSRINRELRTGINVKLGSGPEIKPSWTFIMCDNTTGIQVLSESKQPVVASSGLVAPHGIEFLVQSSVPGARAVKYSLVHDTNNFTVPEIENFTQQVCVADASLPSALGHAKKALMRAKSYVLQERELFRQDNPVESADLINQKLFDREDLPSSYLAFYI